VSARSVELHYSPGSHFVHCTLVIYEGPGRPKPIGKFLATNSEWVDVKASLEGSKVELRKNDFYANRESVSHGKG
jgi:hypothetical protein